MNKLNVLLLVPYFCAGGAGKSSPTSNGYEMVSFGGTDLSTLLLADGFKKKGHNVFVMFADSGLPEEFTERGIPHVLARVDRRTVWGLFQGAFDIRKAIIRNRIRIVHSQTVVPTIMAYLAKLSINKKAENIKIVWHCRGIKDHNYFIVGKIFNWLVDFAIANCDFERNRLIKGGLSPEKIKTVYNCLNFPFPDTIDKDYSLIEQLDIKKDVPVIGTVSRMDSDRGIEYFLQAASILKKSLPEAKFIIVGGGPRTNEYKQLAIDLGLKKNIVFLGPYRDMARIYSILDIFINPRPLETGTANVNAEALAFAKPVVACNSGGVPELIENGVTGVLVPPKNPDELARAVVYLLQNKEIADSIGQRGRQHIKEYFTQERLIEEIEGIYMTHINS